MAISIKNCMRKGKEERNVRKELFWKVPSGGTNDLLARDPFDDCFFDASGFSGGFFSGSLSFGDPAKRDKKSFVGLCLQDRSFFSFDCLY